MKYESTLQTAILNDLRSLGDKCCCFKIEKTNEAGVPDVFFSTILTGGIFVETKRSDGVLSPKQKEKLDLLNNTGAKALVCYSWNEWRELKQKLGLVTRTVTSSQIL
jgi:hypothetical protein